MTTIPSAWLMGATQARVQAGMEDRAALVSAILHWEEQARLAAQWEREHGQAAEA